MAELAEKHAREVRSTLRLKKAIPKRLSEAIRDKRRGGRTPRGGRRPVPFRFAAKIQQCGVSEIRALLYLLPSTGDAQVLK